MASRTDISSILREVEKVVELSRRGILIPREAVNKITDALTHYGNVDLAETVLAPLTPELSSELQAWVREALLPGYRYQFSGVGSLSEDDRQRKQTELVLLASYLYRSGIAPAAESHSETATDA